MPSRRPVHNPSLGQDAFLRKLSYLTGYASVEGVDLTARKWSSYPGIIYSNIGANVLFRLLMNLYLSLSAHLDSSRFRYFPIDFTQVFEEYYEPRPFPPPKGRLDDSDVELLTWYFRRMATTREGVFYKADRLSLSKLMEYLVGQMKTRGADETWARYIFDLYAVVEGKLQVATIVGLAIVGVSRVQPRTFTVRLPPDFTQAMECENLYVYESHVNIARVNYARVFKVPGSWKKETADYFASRVDEQITWQSSMSFSPEMLFWPRVFLWTRVDDLHWEGGKYQLELQRIRNEVKPILDANGVANFFRVQYLNFAYELYYLRHRGHRTTRWWKANLTPEDLIEKYKAAGLDEAILRQIARKLGEM